MRRIGSACMIIAVRPTGHSRFEGGEGVAPWLTVADMRRLGSRSVQWCLPGSGADLITVGSPSTVGRRAAPRGWRTWEGWITSRLGVVAALVPFMPGATHRSVHPGSHGGGSFVVCKKPALGRLSFRRCRIPLPLWWYTVLRALNRTRLSRGSVCSL
jgi:hypothetical protein